MDDISRALGRLEEFAVTARGDLKQIRDDLDELKRWKWKQTGVISVVLFIFQIAINIAFKG